jgi:prepilin peptidase CpaA
MPLLISTVVVVFVALCAATDLRTRRIPNALTGVGALAGALLNAVYFGGPGLLISLAGLVLVVVLLLAPFALGGIGGGDVKMMGAVGAMLGPRLALVALVIGALAGGVIMLAHLAMRGRLREILGSMGGMVAAAIATRSMSPLRVSASDPGAITLPYSVPLALGVLSVLAFGDILRLP